MYYPKRKQVLNYLLALMIFTITAINVSYGSSTNNQQTSTTNFFKYLSEQKTFTADVSQVNIVKDFGKDSYTGKAYIEYAKRALWKYTDPYEQFYLFSPKNVTSYDSTMNQAVVASSSASDNPIQNILFDIAKVYDDFDIKGDASTLFLTPKDKKSPIDNIKILIENNMPSAIVSTDKSGNSIQMYFSNIKLGSKIDDAKFSVKIPKDAIVIEQ